MAGDDFEDALTELNLIEGLGAMRKVMRGLRNALVDKDGWDPAVADQIVATPFATVLTHLFMNAMEGKR